MRLDQAIERKEGELSFVPASDRAFFRQIPFFDKLGKQIKYADSIGIPWVCILGESELAESNVTLKDMRSGDQQSFQRSEVAGRVRNES